MNDQSSGNIGEGACPDAYSQSFDVHFEYPVCFTRNVFDASNSLLADILGRKGEQRRHRAAVYVDSGLAAADAGLLGRIRKYFHDRPEHLELAGEPTIIPGGEAAKCSWDSVRDVMWTTGNLHLDRQSYIIGIGGGGVLDMVGFGASIVHRGLRLVRIPTTTLAQSDAGVGVKNGMDEHGAKNFVGTFCPPWAVINDFATLATLTFEHWIGGVAEAFKVAIIRDAEFLDYLCSHVRELRARESAAMEYVVRRSAIIHLEHIRTAGDPFEFGSSRPLDFGHWAAHKLEALADFTIGHGQAVAVGIAIDLYYAACQGLISRAEMERVVTAMAACGLPIWMPQLDQRGPDGALAILDGLRQFREHLGGELTVTLPDGLGRKCEVHQVNPQHVEQAVAWLGQLEHK